MTLSREADAAQAKGRSLGPLHGIPVTIKDAFEVKGVRTTAGNPAFKDYLPGGDAPVVERFRRAGAVLLGMTNVPFMVSDWQTFTIGSATCSTTRSARCQPTCALF